jgi:Ca2+-binding RTX toxin-like protein
MSKNITNSYTSTYFLSSPGTENPVTVTSTGRIVVNSSTANTTGIFGPGGFAWTLTNLGTVESIGSLGAGIQLSSGGSITNGASGATAALIDGTNQGISIIGGAGTVHNFGRITTTGSQGISVGLRDGGTVTNSGTISATGSNSTAIYLNAGSINNTGRISGNATGVDITAGAGIVFNSGSISETSGTSGNNDLFGINFFGASNRGTITNLGTISALTANTAIHEIAVNFGTAGGQIVNGKAGSSLGLITAYGIGIGFAQGTGGTLGTVTVVNYGTIQSTRTAGGSGNDGFGLQMAGVTTVKNFGVIRAAQVTSGTSGGGGAINLSSGGSITNGASGSTGGLITADGQAIGVYGGAGTIVNFGTISDTGTANGGAVFLGAGGTITNLGMISAAGAQHESAIRMKGTVSDAIVNLGTISGGTSAISLHEGDNVINGQSGSHTGVIIGEFAGIAAINDGAALFNFGTIVNFGTIESTSTVATYKTLSLGAIIGGAGSINNAGLVAGSPAGIVIANTVGGAGIITNSGTIKGATGILISPTDNGKNTVTNSGTIIGTAGTAVQFGAGNDTLIVKPGAVFTGAVKGGGGTDTIIQSAAGTLKVTGFSGFETIRLANGAADSLTLTSANFTGVSGSTITVFDGNSGNTVNASALPSADKIVVHAGTGADTLKGGAGNDIFYAGGNTKMTGGAGTNRFTFAHIGTNGITDFAASATNEIAFSNSGFSLGLGGATSTPQALPGSLIGSLTNGTFSNMTQRFAYNQSTGQLFFDSGGSGGTAHVVATLTGDPTLTAARLFFVT